MKVFKVCIYFLNLLPWWIMVSGPIIDGFLSLLMHRLTQGECIQQLIGRTPIALLGTGNCSDLWVNQLRLYFKLVLVNLVPEVGALVQLFQNTFIKNNKFKKKLPVLTFDLLCLCNFQFKKKETVFRDWICKSLRSVSVYSGIRDPCGFLYTTQRGIWVWPYTLYIITSCILTGSSQYLTEQHLLEPE